MDNPIFKYIRDGVFIIGIVLGAGRIWAEFDQQKKEIADLKERIEDVNKTQHGRSTSIGKDVEAVKDLSQDNAVDIAYIKGYLAAKSQQ